MPILALKLVLTPILIGGASLAARRWGPAVAGALVGMPLTSGPVAFFVAVEQGIPFATEVGLAVLAGGLALCAFAIAYARLAAAALGPFGTLAAASVAYVAVSAALGTVQLPPLPLLVPVVAIALVLTLCLLPPTTAVHRRVTPARWDLPARILVGTSLIVILTTVAPILGPRASGLISTYPVYLSTLTFFAHHQGGGASVAAMQRGLVFGLFGWLAFWTALLTLLPVAGVGAGFGGAIVAAFVIQGLSLRVLGSTSEAVIRDAGEVVP
ncbi:MAG: hypothetical protein EPO36_11810 [Chloroflexota bacterium]|nr:MAG: hypothetical protein EPO36_11810 [Chloroflexota bacterium]